MFINSQINQQEYMYNKKWRDKNKKEGILPSLKRNKVYIC